MFKSLGLFVLVAAMSAAVPPPSAAENRLELRPFAGAYVPTGEQRDQLRNAFVAGLQAGYEVAERMHLVGTLAYAPTRFDGGFHQHIDMYMIDAGLEMFRTVAIGDAWEFRPFLAAGAGIRSYDPRPHGPSATGRPAGYGGIGGEFQTGRVSLRLEGRGYVLRGGVAGDLTAARNDVLITGGGAFHW